MRRAGPSAALTLDFKHEYQVETSARLRQRLFWLAAIWGVVRLVLWAPWWVSGIQSASWHMLVSTTVGLVWIGVIAYILWRCRQPGLSQHALLRMSQWMVFVDGLLFLLDARFGVVPLGLWGVLLAHVVASAVLPWSPLQSMAPIASVLAVAAVLLFIRLPSVADAVTAILLLPLIAIPGVTIAALRHAAFVKKFRFQALHGRYQQIRQDLVDARRIHESLFPAPINDGTVQLAYLYEPMRQIGGDFLFAHVLRRDDDRPPAVSVVLLDVTGHGIAAALTVNRLHGELERVFAEEPQISPGEVTRLLNRYVHLTLAPHSVYVTALCMRIDPYSHILEFANAGHPPAFLRAVNGTIDQLNSTTFVLGAVGARDFKPEPRAIPFGPGDALVAYTDGAIEARNDAGQMFGVQGVQRVLARGLQSSDSDWPDVLLGAVKGFRYGPPADDTVIVELRQSIESAKPKRRPATATSSAS